MQISSFFAIKLFLKEIFNITRLQMLLSFGLSEDAMTSDDSSIERKIILIFLTVWCNKYSAHKKNDKNEMDFLCNEDFNILRVGQGYCKIPSSPRWKWKTPKHKILSYEIGKIPKQGHKCVRAREKNTRTRSRRRKKRETRSKTRSRSKDAIRDWKGDEQVGW